MEIETLNASGTRADLHQRLMDLAGWLLARGLVVKDGDTVGADGDEKIRVEYADSAFGYKGKVMRLNFTGKAPGYRDS